MIIWLASYPKSGNTWVRVFLSSLIASTDNVSINDLIIEQFPQRYNFESLTENISDVSEFVKNCIHAQTKINLDNKVKIFKTHNAFWKSGEHYFTDTNNTLGCIYIVRDPRNVITSVKNHYNKDSFSKALEFINNKKQLLGDLKNSKLESDLPTVISSWKNHYNSWKKIKTNYLLIKYENLLNKPEEEFFKITGFLEKLSNFKFKKDDIIKSIKNTNFDNLKNQEKEKGFKEATKDKFGNPVKFFNLGPENNWKKILDPIIAKEIEVNFEHEMKELGYL
tara:strand:- start:391 stop:1227 length:837 start_codon:yes stop_codon:yes gene_type:complete